MVHSPQEEEKGEALPQKTLKRYKVSLIDDVIGESHSKTAKFSSDLQYEIKLAQQIVVK